MFYPQEENRLKAKAIRDQHEAAARAAGKSTLPPKTASGFVATDEIHIVGGANSSGGGRITRSSRKRPHSETEPAAAAAATRASTTISRASVPASNRDARTTPARPGEEAPLKPARKFTNYVDYNFSAMTDTKGGFLTADDDPHNYALNAGGKGKEAEEQRPAHMTQEEWERKQLLKKLRRQKAGPFEPGMSALVSDAERKKCRECGSLEIDFVWEEVFGICVCGTCKEKHPEKYSLLTKTECRQDYLLTERESPLSRFSFFPDTLQDLGEESLRLNLRRVLPRPSRTTRRGAPAAPQQAKPAQVALARHDAVPAVPS